ncbi:unnamed protein product, partial [Mesocestoides corti]
MMKTTQEGKITAWLKANKAEDGMFTVYRWPPMRVPEDLTCTDSSYDLTLCVRVKSSDEPMETRLHQRLKLLGKDYERSDEESAL